MFNRLLALWVAVPLLFTGCANSTFQPAQAQTRNLFDLGLRDYYGYGCIWSWELERIRQQEAILENPASWFLKYKLRNRITLCDNLEYPPSAEL